MNSLGKTLSAARNKQRGLAIWVILLVVALIVSIGVVLAVGAGSDGGRTAAKQNQLNVAELANQATVLAQTAQMDISEMGVTAFTGGGSNAPLYKLLRTAGDHLYMWGGPNAWHYIPWQQASVGTGKVAIFVNLPVGDPACPLINARLGLAVTPTTFVGAFNAGLGKGGACLVDNSQGVAIYKFLVPLYPY